MRGGTKATNCSTTFYQQFSPEYNNQLGHFGYSLSFRIIVTMSRCPPEYIPIYGRFQSIYEGLLLN